MVCGQHLRGVGLPSICNSQSLDASKKYVITIYADVKYALYGRSPQAYAIRKVNWTSKSKLTQYCAPGGDYAISLVPAGANAAHRAF